MGSLKHIFEDIPSCRYKIPSQEHIPPAQARAYLADIASRHGLLVFNDIVRATNSPPHSMRVNRFVGLRVAMLLATDKDYGVLPSFYVRVFMFV